MKILALQGAEEGLSATTPKLSLLDLCRDERLYPLALALISNEISRLRIPGGLPYFTYEISFGNDTIAADADIAKVVSAFGAAIGDPTLQAKPAVLPGLEGVDTLCIPNSAKAALLQLVFPLLAQLAQQVAERPECPAANTFAYQADSEYGNAGQPVQLLTALAAALSIEVDGDLVTSSSIDPETGHVGLYCGDESQPVKFEDQLIELRDGKTTIRDIHGQDCQVALWSWRPLGVSDCTGAEEAANG